MKFSELNIPDFLLKTLNKLNYIEMTPVQEETYPLIKAGEDICAIAETGSGKTAACSIPLIEKIDLSINNVQGLVVVPTRELCIQYETEISKLTKGTEIKSGSIFGGTKKDFDLQVIRHGVHILVATPGRLFDHLYAGDLSLREIKCVILDEADELLKEGFFDVLEFIFSCLPPEQYQTLLFSATMDKETKKLTHGIMRNPKYISLISKRAQPKSLEHHFDILNSTRNIEKLIKLIQTEAPDQLIIFCNSRFMADDVFKALKKEFNKIDCIHAGILQNKRTAIFDKFKSNRIKYLVATDIASRGLDFSNVTHVINWGLPLGEEQYTHRTGRAGRMGKKGKAITLVLKKELKRAKRLIRRKAITVSGSTLILTIDDRPKKYSHNKKKKPLDKK